MFGSKVPTVILNPIMHSGHSTVSVSSLNISRIEVNLSPALIKLGLKK